jgi:hypothetical protein
MDLETRALLSDILTRLAKLEGRGGGGEENQTKEGVKCGTT